MKAALLAEIGKPLVIQEMPQPDLEAEEVLVETRTCGICRTDLHIQDGIAYVPSLPHVLGHEPAGVVVAVGRGVKRLRVGQAVVPHLFVYDEDQTAGRLRGKPTLRGILGVSLPGGFAEYFKAPEQNLLPLPDGVPFDVAGLTSCALITAVHAYRKAALGMHETAVVLGAGGIGLVLLQLLRASGVRSAAVDCRAPSLNLAREAGAELAVSFDDPTAAEQIGAWARPQNGVNCVFELVGRAGTMKFAADVITTGGRIVVIGEENEFPPIDTITLAQRELQILGSRNGSLEDAAFALDLLRRGVLRPVVAGHFPLDRINDAFELVRSGRAAGRVVVTIEGKVH